MASFTEIAHEKDDLPCEMPNLSACQAELERYAGYLEQVRSLSKDEERFQMLWVDCSEARSLLTERCESAMREMLQMIEHRCGDNNDWLLKRFQAPPWNAI